jgi:hypothetical protein
VPELARKNPNTRNIQNTRVPLQTWIYKSDDNDGTDMTSDFVHVASGCLPLSPFTGTHALVAE